MATIAWIGLGHMGLPMSGHLIEAGHRVVGVDPDPRATEAAAAKGVGIADSLAGAVRAADACVTSLPRPEHVRAVYGGEDGILAHSAPGTLLLDTSTVDVETTAWCHREAAARGLAFVDAPISGGTAGAAAHTLTFMLGGEPDAVERAAGLVAPMAGAVVRCGGAGAGIAAKLANNMMLFVNVMAMAEGAQLAARLGLDPRVFWEVASASSGSSWAVRTWYPVPGVVETAAANRDFEASFSVDLALKDCSLAVAAGTAAGLRLPAAELAQSQLQRLVADGLGGRDCTLVARFPSPDGTIPGWHPSSSLDPAQELS